MMWVSLTLRRRLALAICPELAPSKLISVPSVAVDQPWPLAGMETQWPLTLGSVYAAHISRSLYTVARRIGVHPKFFERLQDGKGCHIATYVETLRWFDLNWPADLQWPATVPRALVKSITAKRRSAA